jgi:large repetitive protein
MKNIFKVIGIIALVAVIGFSMAACGGGDDDNNNNNNNNNNNSGTGTAPTITTASLPNGTVGTAYSQTLAATGDTPITWSIDSGTLPTGLSIAETTGIISGTPTTAATSTFTVKATNAAGSITKSLSITIATSGGGDPTPSVSYIINGSGATFTATKNGATVGTANQSISDVIGYIQNDANHANVGIQFGNGTNVLDIGNNSVTFGSNLFVSNAWGYITLSGKITSSSSGDYTVYIGRGISLTSTADITATGTANGIMNAGTLTVSSGTVSATTASGRSGIRNYGGTVIINSGTISSTGYNGITNEVGSDYGTVTINGGIVSTANVNNTNQYAIRSEGGCTVTITGGTVSATGVNANGGIYNGGTLNISNGTFKSAGASGTSGNTIYNGGTLTISGGTFESAYATIYNRNGTMTMTGGTVSTTYNNANGRAIVGSGSSSNVTINGGTVSAPSNGYAVYNDDSFGASGTGTITIGTSAVINGRKYGC